MLAEKRNNVSGENFNFLLLNSTVGHRDKTVPRIQNCVKNPLIHPRTHKHNPESSNTPRNTKTLSRMRMGVFLDFRECFFILRSVFEFLEVFLDSGKCF